MKEKQELLNSYIKTNVAPILVDFLDGKDIPNAVLLPATIDKTELNGHYEKQEFCPPIWLKHLLEEDEKIILVIDKIDSIPKEEQLKFIEILKYKQVSTFEIPNDYRIVLTAKELNKVAKEIQSLIAII